MIETDAAHITGQLLTPKNEVKISPFAILPCARPTDVLYILFLLLSLSFHKILTLNIDIKFCF